MSTRQGSWTREVRSFHVLYDGVEFALGGCAIVRAA